LEWGRENSLPFSLDNGLEFYHADITASIEIQGLFELSLKENRGFPSGSSVNLEITQS
jgi:hypothetical protein